MEAHAVYCRRAILIINKKIINNNNNDNNNNNSNNNNKLLIVEIHIHIHRSINELCSQPLEIHRYTITNEL